MTKAFLHDNWIFHISKGGITGLHIVNRINNLKKVHIKCRIKNRENGQKINVLADPTNHTICPFRAAYQIYIRSFKLCNNDDVLMGIFINTNKAN